MFNCTRRRLFLCIKTTRDPTITTKTRTTHLFFLQNPFPNTISSNFYSIGEPSLTVSYLTNSCGLPSKAALTVAQKLHLKTTEKPDSVLLFLQDHGFTKAQVTNLVVKCPSLLVSNPDKVLKPKLEFIRGLGISGPDLPKFLSSNPLLFVRSLENRIIPNFNFLKEMLHTNKNIITALKCSTQLLSCDLQKAVVPNVEILRSHGMPECSISRLVMIQPKAMIMCTRDRLNEVVVALKKMGFNLSSPMSVYAIRAMLGMRKSTWERKLIIFRSLGWSDSEILLAFGKIPLVMTLSDNKIRRHMDFLVNKLNLKPASVSAYPGLISRSLEKTIIPRCSVLNILMSKGKIRKNLSLRAALISTKKYFLERFVTRYQDEFPEILDAYQCKIGFGGFKKGFEGMVSD